MNLGPGGRGGGGGERGSALAMSRNDLTGRNAGSASPAPTESAGGGLLNYYYFTAVVTSLPASASPWVTWTFVNRCGY